MKEGRARVLIIRSLSNLEKRTDVQEITIKKVLTMILDAGCIQFVIADIGEAGVFISVFCLTARTRSVSRRRAARAAAGWLRKSQRCFPAGCGRRSWSFPGQRPGWWTG